MTAPVEARYPNASLENPTLQTGETQVYFLYRDRTIQPEQINADVQVEDIPPMTVVSLGLRGSYDHGLYEQSIEKLQAWLKQHPEYAIAGQPRRFFYDGPFIPDVLKRNEVQIPIQSMQN
jgi:hypothetical protein